MNLFIFTLKSFFMHGLYYLVSLEEILKKDGLYFSGYTSHEKRINMIERYKRLLPYDVLVDSQLLSYCIDAAYFTVASLNNRLNNESDTFTLDVGSSVLQPFSDYYLSSLCELSARSGEYIPPFLRDVQQDDHDLYLDYSRNVDPDSRLLLARLTSSL